jgi:hypothetical protein
MVTCARSSIDFALLSPPVMSRSHPQPTSGFLLVDFPQENVLLLTLNRPKTRNAMHPDMEKDLELLLDWFENEPSLWSVFHRPYDNSLVRWVAV